MAVAAVDGLVHHSSIMEMNVDSYRRRWSTCLTPATNGCVACKRGCCVAIQHILNLHRLDNAQLAALLDRLENNELDEYLDIATLIGIEFDENTVWGQLTVLELKLLIHLALKQFEEAQDLVGAFLQYNDNTVERKLFYQALNVVLEVHRDPDLGLDNYEHNFRRMFGHDRMDAVIGSVQGTVRFFGLTPTSMKLEGLDRHHRLMDSYKKLHAARARSV